MKLKNIKGFTLIELLVVMAIIAILSAIMFGPIQTARKRAADTRAVSDMKLLQNYLMLYADDHDGSYPSNLKQLEIYGNVPTRANTTDTSYVLTKYNYTAVNSYKGFHLWTKLSSWNESFNSDADCDSINNAASCWSSLTAASSSFSGTGTDGITSSSVPNACSATTWACILDFADSK